MFTLPNADRWETLMANAWIRRTGEGRACGWCSVQCHCSRL